MKGEEGIVKGGKGVVKGEKGVLKGGERKGGEGGRS